MTAQRIKDIMKQKKMGNKALAESSGVPLGTLNKILYGETTNPSLDTMRAIASVLECSLDEFIDDLSDGAGRAGERDDLTEYLDELHKRPELKTLFSVAKNASREDVEKAVKIIEMFSNNNSDDI